MAENSFSKQEYLLKYGATLDFILLITNQLYNHPNATEIIILGEEVIPREEALRLIKVYLETSNASTELIQRFADSNLPLHQRINLVHAFLIHQKQELLVSNTAKEDVLRSYQEFLESRQEILSEYPPLQQALTQFREQVAQYNRNLMRVNQALVGETPQEQAQQRQVLEQLIPPPQILTDKETNALQSQLTQLLPTIAAQLPLSQEPPEVTVYKTLKKEAKNNRILEAFLAYNADPAQQELLVNTITSAIDRAIAPAGLKVADLQKQQLQLTSLTRNLSLTRQQLDTALTQRLISTGRLDEKTARSFTTKLLNESVRLAYVQGAPLKAETLIDIALNKSKLSLTEPQKQLLLDITKTFHPDLEIHNQTQILEARQRGLGYRTFGFLLPAEVRIALKTGVDPSIIDSDYKRDIKKVLKDTSTSNLQQAWNKELAKPEPDLTLLHTISLLQDHQTQKTILKQELSQQPWLIPGYTWHKTTNFVSSVVNKYHRLSNQAWDLWFKFEDHLPHNQVGKLFDKYYTWRAEKMKTGLGWIINPMEKALDKWDGFKERVTLKVLTKYQGSKSFGGKAAFRLASLYSQGHFTLSGFAQEAVIYTVSKGYHLAKKAAKKLFSKAVKKIGAWVMKKVAQWGLEGTVAAISNVAAPVVAAIFIAAEVIDILKMAWQNREAIGKFAVKAAAAAYGIIYGIQLLIKLLITKFVGAFSGAFVGALALAPFGLAPLGALIGFFVGLNWSTIAAWLSSVGSSISAFLSSFAAAVTSAVTAAIPTIFAAVGASVGAVGLMWTMTFITAQISTQGVGGGVTDAGEGSPYIEITKEATANFDREYHLPNINLSSQTISYKIEVKAVDKNLEQVTVTDITKKLSDSGNGISDTQIGETRQESADSIAVGDAPLTIEYSLPLDNSFADSYIINTVEVTATVDGKTETKSLSVNIGIGDPPVLPIADFAIILAQAIDSCYGTTVTLPDGGKCLKDLNNPQIDLAIPYLVSSANAHKYLQCVGFAAAVEVGTGGSLGASPGGIAAGYINQPDSAHIYIANDGGTTPLPGDLFLMGTDEISGTGHIGVVVGVAGNQVLVADANWNGKGQARATGSIPSDRIAGYLRRK